MSMGNILSNSSTRKQLPWVSYLPLSRRQSGGKLRQGLGEARSGFSRNRNSLASEASPLFAGESFSLLGWNGQASISNDPKKVRLKETYLDPHLWRADVVAL
jgi:hypothetical protein